MWISDCRVVLLDRVLPNGAVRIEDGMIAEISEKLVANADMSAQGLILMPGFIDMHGDMVEREVEPRPNVRMPLELGLRDLDRRLAVSGVTTAYAALSFSPASTYGHLRSYEHTSSVIRAIKTMRDQLLVDHKVHARFEITFPKALAVIEELIAEGSVDLISLNDHTPGQGQYRDVERHIEKLAREKGMSLEEAAQSIARRIEERTQPADVMTHTLDAISKACHAHGVAIASHDDDTVAKVQLMHSLGVLISEFPVTLEAAAEAATGGCPSPRPDRPPGPGTLQAALARGYRLLRLLCTGNRRSQEAVAGAEWFPVYISHVGACAHPPLYP